MKFSDLCMALDKIYKGKVDSLVFTAESLTPGEKPFYKTRSTNSLKQHIFISRDNSIYKPELPQRFTSMGNLNLTFCI